MNLKCLLMPDFVGNPKNIVISSETLDVTHVRSLGSFSQDKSLKCTSLKEPQSALFKNIVVLEKHLSCGSSQNL